MEKIKLSYNIYNKKYIVLKNNEEISANDSWLYKKNQELELWVSGFAKRLFEYINDDISLTFKGYEYDYKLLEKEIENFNSSQKDVYIELSFKKLKSDYDILEELKDLFNYMQETSPFDELRAKKLKEIFERGECEVAVISAMSSGKSTLLNALLGRDLLPSKNEACSAAIVRIKDVDGAYGFNAKCLDENENIVVEEVKNVSADTMSSFNENESVSYIDVEGDIPFVESHNIQLVLLDTPAPNNSIDLRFRKKTFSVIKDSNPMILYILNAAQLSTNDDNALLDAVGDAMNQGGKQSRDRFMFVVNKVDCFDPDKGESVEEALTNVKDYLKYHGIGNSNIYLASSYIAKVIRLYKNGYELSRKEKRDIEVYKELFEEFDEFHLFKYASLSKRGHDKINAMLDNAEDELDRLLVYSGIPSIEIAINEYLEKYAITTKVEQAVSTFIGQINSKNIEGNLIDTLKNDAERAMVLHGEDIKEIKKCIKENERNHAWLKDFVSRLNNILEI